jgi:hypothetical protein
MRAVRAQRPSLPVLGALRRLSALCGQAGDAVAATGSRSDAAGTAIAVVGDGRAQTRPSAGSREDHQGLAEDGRSQEAALGRCHGTRVGQRLATHNDGDPPGDRECRRTCRR